jgi:DNA-binding MarR family transcriptional regulator
VTAKGREMLSRANAAFLGRLQELVAPLTAAERIELVRLMRKLSERGR